MRFRSAETRESLRLLAERARGRKPDILVAVNIGIGSRQRAVLDNGNWFGNLDSVDYTYAENSFFPAWRDGAIVSQHWPMGIGESIGIHVVPGAGCRPRRRCIIALRRRTPGNFAGVLPKAPCMVRMPLAAPMACVVKTAALPHSAARRGLSPPPPAVCRLVCGPPRAVRCKRECRAGCAALQSGSDDRR